MSKILKPAKRRHIVSRFKLYILLILPKDLYIIQVEYLLQDCGIQTENMEPPPDGSDISRPHSQTAASEESRQDEDSYGDDVLELPAVEDDIFVDASSSPLADIRT